MTSGSLQMYAAICADRVGDAEDAQQIFSLAVESKSLSDDERKEFEETRQPYNVWEWAIERAYALFCLKDFNSALAVGEEAVQWIDKDSSANLNSSTEMPLLILPTVLALINYELDPSTEKRTEVIRLLDRDAVATRSHADYIQALFYLFNLRAKYPELASPDDEDLPPAARAQQAAEACRLWAAKAGIQLDGKPESLMVLDKHLTEIYRNINDAEQQKLVLFMLGSYFGEVVKNELAGGKWNFSEEMMLAWTIDWDMGDVELHLWPFQRVHEYGTSKIKENLTDLWSETEQAYLDFGLAALYSE
jgi:tetratricopeptide (TPR) repeat protein